MRKQTGIRITFLYKNLALNSEIQNRAASHKLSHIRHDHHSDHLSELRAGLHTEHLSDLHTAIYQLREGFEAQEKARLEERRAKVLAFIEAHSKM